MGAIDRAVVCLIAEDNPISAKILETLLVRLGCRCIMAADGAEAISTAHGDISKLLHFSTLSPQLTRFCRIRSYPYGLPYASS